MATLSGVRLPNNNRPKKISQQGLGSKPIGGPYDEIRFITAK